MSKTADSRRALFVSNTDSFFLSHWLPLPLALKAQGFDVVVASADTGSAHLIRSYGLSFIPIRMARSSMKPHSELSTAVQLARLYRRLQPDLIHHIAMKAVIYGSIAARTTPSAAVVNTITGLGFTFARAERNRVLQTLVLGLLRMAASRPRTVSIIENADDVRELGNRRILDPARIVLIRGAGVDLERFVPQKEPDGIPIVMLGSRMLWDKGVGEFVEAARVLTKKGAVARFVLVGGIDEGNPASIPTQVLEEWMQEGVVEWWGHRVDMEHLLPQSTIVTLPSYREGLPKILAEAAACGKPIVTTDVPGCREVVANGVNGLLVPAQDSAALASAIKQLLESPVELREDMGVASREMAERRLGLGIVIEQTLEVYHSLLADR
jgi:glycosyltransferase involved in cell wall biosynthesis